jgi:hypothetical protein
MSNGYLNGFNTIYFNNECFVIDKFSGFRGVEHDVKYNSDLGKWRIEYSAEIYFSGNNLKLKRFAHVNYSDDLSWSLFGKSPTKESDFIMNKCSWRDFEKSGFNSGKSNKVMHDYYRWFAENTGTTDVLNKLKEDIETCFQLIDEANSKEKTN